MTAGLAWKLRIRKGGAALNPLSLSGTPLTSATINGTADFTITATGGTAPYTYAKLSGTFPTGQSINSSTGAVTGTITAAATYSGITLKVTDAVGTVSTLAPYSVVVSSPAADFTLTGTPILTSTIGTAMTSFLFTPVGSTGSITWTFDTANGYIAPTGITVVGGLVSGTPGAATDGTYRMRVKAVDSLGGVGYSAVWSFVVQPTAGALVFVLSPPATTTTQLQAPTKTTNTTFSMHGISLYMNTSKNPTHVGSQYYTVGAEAGAPYYETGAAPQMATNYYPFRSGDTVNSLVRGGRIVGRFTFDEDAHIIDWIQPAWPNPPGPPGGPFSNDGYPTGETNCHSYNNGAAMLAQSDPSTSLTISRVRVHAGWDSIRPQGKAGLGAGFSRDAAAGLCHHYIAECWISDSYDDAIENDNCQSLTITDTLIDGCNSGISMTPGGTFDSSLTDHLTIDGLLLRTRDHKNSAKISGRVPPDVPVETGDIVASRAPDYLDCGAPFKMTDLAPNITISNSIICFNFANTYRASRWVSFWAKHTDGGGNKLLYTGGDTMPSSSYIGNPGAGWTQQTGATAVATWAAAKAAWIAAHPYVYKTDTD